MKAKFEIFILIKNKQATTLTKQIATRYKTYSALRDTKGPHISFIYLNKKLNEDRINELIGYYEDKLKKIKPFYLEVSGISFFRKYYGQHHLNYAVILKVIPDKNLVNLNRIFNSGIKDIDHRTFNKFQPHISLARTDLDKEKFYGILKDYKDHKIKFKVWLTCIYAGTRRKKRQKWKLVKMKLGT
ncbi:MAG: 2'-5' RNA ligase family protein [Candidatus Micrarchaeota archaeon]|nr:2'-5' RNA ligase family protein [Candidatus Micrarchaeota archaeon]